MSRIRHEPRSTVTMRVAAGYVVDRHRHDQHQIVYVSSGVVVVQTANGSWVASRDRGIWLPAGVWHEHRFYGASNFHTVGFPAATPPLAAITPMVVTVSPLLRELLIAYSDFNLSYTERQRMRGVIRDQLKRSPEQPIALPEPRDPRLAEACSLAADHLDENFALCQLANHVGTSERTLSRLFREELGMTYPQWRRNNRILQAAILLSSGVSVTTAGIQCGWETTSSFIAAFAQAMGQTPGSYRTAARQTRKQA